MRQLPAVRTAIWARADTIVWLDLPRPVVMWRVTSRSFGRVVRRTELWNGNRESAANLLALHDPERSIVRWAWDGVERYRRLYVPAMASTTWADLRWYRLRSPARGGAMDSTAVVERTPPLVAVTGSLTRSAQPSLPRMPTITPGEGGAPWRAGSSATRWSAGV